MRILVFIVLLISNSIYAQIDYTLLANPQLPQHNKVNPAHIPKFKNSVGLPLLSGVHLNLYSNSISFSDLVNSNNSFDMQKALSNLKDNNSFAGSFSISWLDFGHKHGDWYFNFSTNEHTKLEFTYPKSLVELLWEGNGAFLGQNVYLEGLAFDFMHYREFSFGVAKKLDKHFSAGINFKYLNGKSVLESVNSDLFFYTDAETYNTLVYGSYSNRTAGLFNVDGNSADYQLFGNKNHGMAIDIGVNYQKEKWAAQFSMIDFGFINWQDNANIRYDDSIRFEYEGVEVNNVFRIPQEIDSNMAHYSDSITEFTNFKTLEKEFSTTLPMSFVFGASYQLTKTIQLSGHYVHYHYKDQYRPMLMVNGNYSLKNWLTIGANYNLYGSNFGNIGINATLKLGAFQFYAVTNNIASHFSPEKSKNLNFRAGLNLVFMDKKKKVKN